MGLKDIYREDLRNVFFGMEEFAERHIVDGREMTIVTDNYERIKHQKAYTAEDGIYMKRLLFYVRAEEFGKLPQVGRIMKLDGTEYRVSEAARQGAVYLISLEAARSK